MKQSGAFLAAIVLILMLAMACNSHKSGSPEDNNPVFKQDPVLKSMTEEIGKNPANPALWGDRGNALRKMKLDSLAINDYKHAITLDSNNASLYSLVGDLLFERKDIVGSEQWLRKALEKDPKDKKENKWSHFNKCIEAILKDARFRASPYEYSFNRDMTDPKRYFRGIHK